MNNILPMETEWSFRSVVAAVVAVAATAVAVGINFSIPVNLENRSIIFLAATTTFTLSPTNQSKKIYISVIALFDHKHGGIPCRNSEYHPTF